ATLRAIDLHWMEHLDTMDYLRTGIGLRGYGQRDPLVEYQKEGHRLFQQLMSTIKSSIADVVFRAEAVREEAPIKAEAHHQSVTAPHRITADGNSAGGPANNAAPQSAASAPNQSRSANQTPSTPLKNEYKDVGRNDPCPCGSGKKFKK